MRLRRLVALPITIALLLALVPIAAVSAWQVNCGNIANGKVCVWSGSNWTVPKAGRDGSDSNYSGDVYPNTMISIDNSASSVANYYPAKDVTWHWEPSNKGFALCVDSGMGYASLPGWDNDMYSSHQVSLDDNAC
jgi:hypothetical protein